MANQAIIDQNKYAELGYVPARSYCIYPLDADKFGQDFRANSHLFTKEYLKHLDVKLFDGMILLEPKWNYECRGCYYEMWVDIIITYYTYLTPAYNSNIFYFFTFDRDVLKKTINTFKDKPKLQKELEKKVCSEGLVQGFEFLKKILANY